MSPYRHLSSSMLRTRSAIKSFTESGDEVSLLCTSFQSIHTTNLEKDIPELKLIEIPGMHFYSQNKKNNLLLKSIIKIMRIIYHKFSIYDHTKYVLQKVNIDFFNSDFFDLIITVSDPKTSHLAGKKLISQGLKYKYWLQYWGDPMAIDITKKNIYPKFILKKYENRIIEQADKIVYTSFITLEKHKKIFKKNSHKMSFIPTSSNSIINHNEQEKINWDIGYFGAYNKKIRDLRPLYKAIKYYKRVRLLIVGDSNLKLKPRINISILNRQDTSELINKVNIMIVVLNKKGTQIPGKIYHYSSSKKPILVILDGDYRKLVKDYFTKLNRYYFCQNNKKSILDSIEKILHDQTKFEPIKEFDYKYTKIKLLEGLVL